jgi:hypothetical protein
MTRPLLTLQGGRPKSARRSTPAGIGFEGLLYARKVRLALFPGREHR